MNDINVSLDGDLHCFAVHWQRSLDEVKGQMEAWGFNGIKNLQTEGGHINGNKARTEVVAMAKKHDAKYYFKGNYDWNGDIPHDAQIYSFDYSSYSGDLTNGDASKDDYLNYFAGWSGHA